MERLSLVFSVHQFSDKHCKFAHLTHLIEPMPLLKKIHPLLAIALILSIGILTSYQFADDTILREILSKFSKYNERLQQNKIYLHVNKSHYATGETIWFKAYQVNGTTHEPYSMSKVI